MPPDSQPAPQPAPSPAPAAAPAPAPEPSIAYESQLSPELRQDKSIHEAIKDYPKLNDLVKAHRDLKKRSERSIVIPNKENPDPGEAKAFRDWMGLPETADGYTFDTASFKGLEGIDEVVALARKEAAGMSLTTNQAQKFANVILGLSKAGKDQLTAAMKEAADTFPKRLAEAAGSPEKATEATNLLKAFMVKAVGDAGLITKFHQSGLLYDTDFVLKVAAIQELLGEEPFIEGENGQRRGDRVKAQPKGSMMNYSSSFGEHYGPRKAAR